MLPFFCITVLTEMVAVTQPCLLQINQTASMLRQYQGEVVW